MCRFVGRPVVDARGSKASPERSNLGLPELFGVVMLGQRRWTMPRPIRIGIAKMRPPILMWLVQRRASATTQSPNSLGSLS